MDALVAAEIVVGVCLGAVILLLLFVAVRRSVLARGGDLLLCGLRTDPQARWKAGLLRFDGLSLAWLPLLGVSLWPEHCWQRTGLDIGGFEELPPGDGLDANSVRTVLRGQPLSSPGGDSETVELSMGRDTYTALRSWVEASPPRHRPVEW
ncbi:DUF2550 family protein [Austwickia chelonae]|uniref:DUF2550 family protein n=1 Tax=Austwickia chelonae TaxID=100225 RepID=UPI0013C37119|nr:DUF2550 family protein [Austwickia chelonae]